RDFRKLQFPITFRQQIANNEAALRALSPDGTLPEPLQKALDKVKPPPLRKRAPRLDAPHKPFERDVQRAIIEALRLHPRVIKVTRFNSGGSMHRGANGKDYLVMFSSEPVPDLFVLLRGGFAWLEVKRPGWQRPTDLREERQAAFLAAVREAGGIGCFVRSIDEAIAVIA
ncbi:MAG: hypothetical protein U0990_09955, partial [Candidatus Nanopelagicales bacterium]|nr:hypothetical protein [Candidatus Nanopelagicales bacterium]